MEKTISKRKKNSLVVFVLLIASILISGSVALTPLVRIANAVDVTTHTDSNSSISIWVWTYEPRVEWFDFQYNNSGTWESRLNQQIDVNETYRFVMNITSDQGWDNVDYINITGWFDNGSEATTYNDTGNIGGNKNFFIQYENTTGNASWSLLWPDDEATIGSWTDTKINTDTHNLTVEFIPSVQFNYAPDPINTAAGFNDLWSWNFNITASDEDDYYSYNDPIYGEALNEFGVYSYTSIVSTVGPDLNGAPGGTANGTNVSIQTITNGNHTLTVEVDTLIHGMFPAYNMSNTTVWVRGGDLDALTNFSGTGPIYLYGSNVTYHLPYSNDTSYTTSDLEYECSIPISQLPGNYSATIHYTLTTQTG
jgi:hypothetical protein